MMILCVVPSPELNKMIAAAALTIPHQHARRRLCSGPLPKP
jgi:hypothetical protein